MEFVVIPFEGTDKIKLGMTSEEIQTLTRANPKRLNKTKWRMYDVDKFEFGKVEYDNNGKSMSIEFDEPSKVVFNNMQLVGKSYLEVETMFKQLDDTLNYKGKAGFASLKYQIGIYAPFAPEGKVETVLVGRKDYYDYE